MTGRSEVLPTRARILDAAVCRFGRVGYSAASMEEIAGDVGISKPAIYHHFRGKDDILAALLDTLLELAERQFTKLRDLDVPFPTLLERLIEQRLSMAKARPDWVRFMQRIDLNLGDVPVLENLRRRGAMLQRLEEELFAARLRDFSLREGITMAQFVQVSHDAVFAFIARTMRDGGGGIGDPAVEARRLCSMILFGVCGSSRPSVTQP